MADSATVPIETAIIVARAQRVILASDLARIYGAEPRVLNQAVKRNIDKFPEDFIFRLTRDEAEEIAASRSQIVILKRGRNVKYLPFAFTEHGAIAARGDRQDAAAARYCAPRYLSKTAAAPTAAAGT